MKLLLDSAKVDEIRYAIDSWGLDGVTTNPRHVRASGRTFHALLHEIAEVVSGTDIPVSVEVNPHLTDRAEIVRQGRQLAALSPNFVVKVGVSEIGCAAMRDLADDGIRVNATLIFSVAQAWHAARAGAAYVSPFIGWKEQFGDPAATFIREVRTMLDRHGYEAEIIAAAMRNAAQLGDAAMAGAHCVTAGIDVYRDSFKHPFTKMGEGIFQSAWDDTPGNAAANGAAAAVSEPATDSAAR